MPKVFISYARDGGAGEVLAYEVQTQLQQQNFEVFRDVIGLKPGESFPHRLEFELESSDLMVLVVSEKVRKSEWVYNEYSLAKELNLPVVPLLAEVMRLPLWLRNVQIMNFCDETDWTGMFDALGLKIPPVPPFAKGGTFRLGEGEADRMVSPFEKGGTRGISTPAWAEAADTDQYGKYADLDVKGVIQRFRWIEPGTFMMGSPQNEAGRFGNEVQHEVTLTQGFWLADTAVSQTLWQVVMGNNPSYFEGEQFPVENVSWKDCRKFIIQLNQQYPGLNTMLPTEAEWEYACRAGTTTRYVTGEQITSRQANFVGNAGETVAVKHFQPNGWGLYQMHGNVWEWCEDVYAEYLPESITDPQGSASASSGSICVIRGGSWSSTHRDVRSANRNRNTQNNRSNYVGFRLAQGQS